MVRAESLSWDMVLLNQSLNRRSAEKLLCRRRCGHTHQDVQEDENLGDHQLSFFGELLHKVNDVNEIFGGRALGVEVRKLLFQLVDVNVPIEMDNDFTKLLSEDGPGGSSCEDQPGGLADEFCSLGLKSSSD